MNTIALAILLIILSGFFQGTFGLGMRKFAPLAWEAFWAVFSLFGMIIIPFIWTVAVVPDPLSIVSSVPPAVLAKAIIFGALWGIGAIMYGYTMNYLGVSLGNGITMGLASAAGTLVPLFQISDFHSKPSFPYIITGVIIMLLGVGILTLAGIRRDDMQTSESSSSLRIKYGKQFYAGLLMAILCGLLSAFANIGFSNAQIVAEYAELKGALPRNASLTAWMVVFYGNFVINFAWAVFLLVKNKSFSTYISKSSPGRLLWALATAFMWYAALALYGQGAALMGTLGTVVGWTMFIALALVISNVWGIAFGEWKGFKKPLGVLMIGNLILIISFVILGYANSL
jgi:L-rhamnose-H+ transport protein